MKSVEVILDEIVSTKEDLFGRFEGSAINPENSIIPNWNALEEIVIDAVKYHGFEVTIRGLSRTSLDESSLDMLMDILNSAIAEKGPMRLRLIFD